MLDGGVPVALSTDGVPHSMLWTAWEALARWDDDGQRQLGDSRLTREEALRMAAQSGHRLTWNEDRYGSLEVGKVADMVVLAEDPLSCDLDRLKDIRVDRTFLGGRQVFRTDLSEEVVTAEFLPAAPQGCAIGADGHGGRSLLKPKTL